MRVVFLIGVVCIGVLVTSCKPKCEGVNERTEKYITLEARKALLGFPKGTRWIFQCVSTGEKDTIYLTNQTTLPFDQGSCVDSKDCCSRYYYEHIEQNFEVHSTSGLNKFSGYTLEASGFWMNGVWRSMLVENSDPIYSSFPGNAFNNTLVLAISNKTLYDLEIGGEHNDPSTLVYAYWSKMHGLVKYVYKTETGTIIKEYERVDLP